ncbi:MAG: type II toxin-antitoxin system RelE/ParE family toxin [Putridiphycobacter sp.]
MEKKIEWSKRSEINLENIFDYISKDSVIYATRFVTKLVEYTEQELTHYPEIGRKVPEFEKTPLDFLREIVFRGYRIIYHPHTTKSQITIIAVLSGRMSVPKSMGI